MIVVILLGVALAIGAVTVIVTPFLRPPRPELTATITACAELRARRDRIYGELRELEFDARVGKVSPLEYAEARERLELDGARVLRAIDLEIQALDDAIERDVGALRSAGVACLACGATLSASSRFCPICGAAATAGAIG